jgi:hypothetical protein
MQKNADLYNLTQQLQGTMYQAGQKHYLASLSEDERDNQPQRPPLMNIRGGSAESIGWMMVQLLEFDPEPLTVEKFRVRAIYSAPRLSQALLELIASEKWTDRKGEEYSLTDAGRAVITNLVNTRNVMFANFEPIPTDDLSKLVEFSQRIIKASLKSGDEKATWCLRHSQNRKPDDIVSAISKLIHVASDFNAFRDDAHMAAFKEQNADAITWEAFSFIRDGNATTADELYDQLAYRGWTINEWQDALDVIKNIGWTKGNLSGYQVTEMGEFVSHAVEKKTDDLFYAPWNTLSNEEQVEYIHLLNTLNDTCMSLISE